jgi:Galactose-3-O-sulfotransferase
MQMEEQFNLVMISEHMESSLVLLADMMCWPLEDMTSIKLNVQPSNLSRTYALNKEDREKLREMNWADMKIYKHFLRKFRLRVRQFGEDRMKEQVRRLKRSNRQLEAECVERVLVPGPKLKEDNSFAVNAYELKLNAPEICHLMVMPELNFTDLIRQDQIKRFRNKHILQ